MAKYNLDNYLEKDGLGFPLNFRRGNPNPLDNSSVWKSLSAAQNYAQTDPTAYVGQILSVVNYTPAVMDDEGVVTTPSQSTVEIYYIKDEAGNLEAVGTSPVGDDSTIVVAEDGTVSLYGIDGLELTRTEEDGAVTNITYQPLYVNGKLTWVEPSATTVEGLATEIEGLKTRISSLENAVGDEDSGLVKEVAGLGTRMTTAEGDITAINTKIGEVAADTTVVQMIADATYDDTQIKADIKTNADAIGVIEADYLKAADKYDDTVLAGRVKAIEDDYLKATDKEDLQTQINTIMNNPDTEGVINSINEFTQYIAEHGEIAEGFRTDIDANAKAISDHETTAAQTYETKTDASAKLTEAKEYADGLNTAMDGRMQDVEEAAHSHDNKDVIDDITAEQVTAWNAAEQNAKNYADGLKAEVDTALEGKVAVEEGKSLIADTLISKLEGISEGAQVNAIDTVDDTQFGLANKHLTLLDIAMGKVTGLQDALDAKANKGTTLAEYGITNAYTKTETEARIQEVLDGLSDTSETAASVAQALETYKTSNDQRVSTIEGALATKVEAEEGKSLIADTLIAKLEAIEAGAQVNKIEVIKVGDTVLEIAEKTVVIPVGAGLKASDEITVAEDGALGIGEVNVNKLVQTDGEDLILNGGSAV